MGKDLDLEEIRKRQQELVETKKVKQGQEEAPKLDRSKEIVPKTKKEKLGNFWYHYKWHTIISVVAVCILTTLIVSIIRKPNYDITIYSLNAYETVLNKEKQTDSFQPFVDDLNQDGKTHILVDKGQIIDLDNIKPGTMLTPQAVQASSVKLMAALQSFSGYIFIIDQYTYDSLTYNDQTGERLDMFYDLSQYTAQNPAFQGDKIYLKDTHLADEWGFSDDKVPDDLFLCLRDFDKYLGNTDKISNRNKQRKEQYEDEKKVFENIIQSILNEEK